MTWVPHRTARQKAKDRNPLARKLNKAAVLAPRLEIEPVLCEQCGTRPKRDCLKEGRCEATPS